jgi:hypothetical protein
MSSVFPLFSEAHVAEYFACFNQRSMRCVTGSQYTTIHAHFIVEN